MENPRLTKLFEFLAKEPNDSFVLYAIATEYNAQSDLENALKYYLKLTEIHPDYVGTYYHLGKLYEKIGEKDKAVLVYETGITEARKKRDMHALSELQGAFNSVAGLDYEDD